MPLTYVERKKKYVEKLKANGLYEDYKRQRAEKQRERRERMKSDLERLPKALREKTLKLNRAYNRERVGKYRQRLKQQKNGKSDDTAQRQRTIKSEEPYKKKVDQPYKTASALAKAVAKVKRSLPSSYLKRKAVIMELFYSLDLEDQQEIINNLRLEQSYKADGQQILVKDQLFHVYDVTNQQDIIENETVTECTLKREF